MENAFPPDIKIDEKYDLKGSTVGRHASEAEKANEDVILKDLDISRVLLIGSENKKKFMEQMEKDTKFLADNNTMDYSFLIGVARNYKTKVKAEESSDQPKKKSGASNYWRRDDGGIASTEKDELYFMLIIDIFTTWNTKKKLENSLKSLIHESMALSAVEPSLYRDRFIKFISALVH